MKGALLVLLMLVASGLSGCAMPNHKWTIYSDEPAYKKKIVKNCAEKLNIVRKKRKMAQIDVVEVGQAPTGGSFFQKAAASGMSMIPGLAVIAGPAAKTHNRDKRVYEREMRNCLRDHGL